MPVIIKLYAGVDMTNPITLDKLQALVDQGYGIIIGQFDTDDIADGVVTATKLATTLDLSSHAITMPSDLLPVDPITPASTEADFVGQVGLDSSDKIYIAFGTAAGEWIQVANDQVASVISGTPDYIGQLALYDAGNGLQLYIAVGTNSSADWQGPQVAAMKFTEQAADPGGETKFLTIWAKDNGSGSVELYYRSETGGVIQLTGVVGTAPAGVASPDWDSGWTQVTKNTTYDLSSVALAGAGPYYGGFSLETKGTTHAAAWGLGNANDLLTDVITPLRGAWGFRIIQVLIRHAWDGVGANYYDEVMYLAANHIEQYTSFQYGWWVFWDDGAGKLMLQTAVHGVLRGYAPVGNMDWPGSYADDALMRIKLWI